MNKTQTALIFALALMEGYVVVRHKRTIDGENSVELLNKDKFDFTDYLFLRKNEVTGYEEYCHKDDYDLYQKQLTK